MTAPDLTSMPNLRRQLRTPQSNNVFGQRPQHAALRMALAYPMVVSPQQNAQRRRKAQGASGGSGSMFPRAGQLGGF